MCLRHVRAAAAALVACIPLAVPSPVLADGAAARGRLCDEGLTRARAGDPAGAFLYLDECLVAGAAGARAAEITAARDKALATLGAGSFAPVDIEADPADARATVPSLGPVDFALPRRVWLPFGGHEIRATAPGHQGVALTISVSNPSPGPPVRLVLPVVVDRGGEGASVDFAEEGGTPPELETAGDLAAAEHDQLLKDKYRKGLAASASGDEPAGPRRFSLGLQAGLAMARLGGDGAPGGTRVGAAAGVGLRYALRPGLALRPELAFAMRGADGAGIDYVEVPVLGELDPVRGRVTLAIAAGPVLGVAVADDIAGGDVQRFDLGVAAAVGARTALGGGSLSAEVRGQLGLTRVDGAAGASRITNRGLALLVGYWF